jgi:hypothetical protein
MRAGSLIITMLLLLTTRFLPIPASPGEDKLAHFGAYREYE